MHSERHREPNLSHSRSDVFSWTTTGLSTLTQRANQNLGERLSQEDENYRYSASMAHLKSGSNRLPSESDYKRVIEKLTRLYAQGGVDSQRTTLQEGKNHDLMLEADDWIYARINLQGRACPAVLTLSRNRGRVVSYVSKTIQEPMEMVCDAKFTGDRIWVSDPGVRFRANTLFIGFHALDEAIFTVNVQFGHKKKTQKGKYHLNVEAFGKDDYWTKLFSSFIEPKPKLLKNFVEINRANQGRESPDKAIAMAERSVFADNRRREALKRWKEHQILRKTKAIEVVNRQELKEIEREKQLQLMKERAAIENAHRKWVAMIWGLTTFEHLIERFTQRKEEVAAQFQKVAACLKIQQAYRKRLKRSDRLSIGLRRCCLNFRMAFRHLADLEGSDIKGNLMKCIRSSAKNARLPIQFQSFYAKGKCYSSFLAPELLALYTVSRKEAD